MPVSSTGFRGRSLALLGAAVVLVGAGCQPGPDRPGHRGADRPLRLTTASGQPTEILPGPDGPLTVFIFTHTDCPVANRYAPELSRIHAEYTPRGVDFYLVYVDPALTGRQIEAHRQTYSYSMPAIRDPYHDLVGKAGAIVTPEVALFGPGGALLYCGRIDDRYVDFGKARAEASQRELRDAIEAALAGKTIARQRTTAVGCYIADIEPQEEPDR